MKKKMKHYTVWFDQINQTRFEVLAENENQAQEKAIRKWNKEFKDPFPSWITEDEPLHPKVPDAKAT